MNPDTPADPLLEEVTKKFLQKKVSFFGNDGIHHKFTVGKVYRQQSRILLLMFPEDTRLEPGRVYHDNRRLTLLDGKES